MDAHERPPGAEEKPWGWMLETNRQTYERADGSIAVQVRTVRVFIKAGGYSSVHKHNECTNLFSVIEGKLLLRRMEEDPPYNKHVEWLQEPGDQLAVFTPGVYHQFEAVTDVLALEVYVATDQGDAAPSDIDRVTKNGVKCRTQGGVPYRLENGLDFLQKLQ